MRVLVVEDEDDLRYAVAAALRSAGIAVDAVDDLPEAHDALSEYDYACVVFDRMLPAGDSIKYVQFRRGEGWDIPVLFLTARDSVADRVAGFAHGGDDYLVKPFALAELVARVLSLGRRAQATHGLVRTVVRVADIEIDTRRRQVRRNGVLLTLTAKEFAVLEHLALQEGEVISRKELIEQCWDAKTRPASNVVDVLVTQLRRKLGAPSIIHTVRGVGYTLDSERTKSKSARRPGQPLMPVQA
jgi:DNA-binding response OmpR family regulator